MDRRITEVAATLGRVRLSSPGCGGQIGPSVIAFVATDVDPLRWTTRLLYICSASKTSPSQPNVASKKESATWHLLCSVAVFVTCLAC